MVDFYGINVGKYTIVPWILGVLVMLKGDISFPVVPLVFRVSSFGDVFNKSCIL